MQDSIARAALRTALDGVRDVERLAGKTAALRANPRDVRALGDSLARLPQVEAALQRMRVAGALADNMRTGIRAPISQRRFSGRWWSGRRRRSATSETIAAGVDPSLDDLRAIATGGKDAIALLQSAERERTGINSLKVGYNKVFGYFIEVTNANSHLVPQDYQRRQTLTGAERYVTPALKEFEEKVLHATERIDLLERQLFDALRARIGAQIARLQRVAGTLAQLDVLATLARGREPRRIRAARGRRRVRLWRSPPAAIRWWSG